MGVEACMCFQMCITRCISFMHNPLPLERISSLRLWPSGISCRRRWVLWISLSGASELLPDRDWQGSAVNGRHKEFLLGQVFCERSWRIVAPGFMSHLNFSLLECSEQLLQGVDSACVDVTHRCWRVTPYQCCWCKLIHQNSFEKKLCFYFAYIENRYIHCSILRDRSTIRNSIPGNFCSRCRSSSSFSHLKILKIGNRTRN